MWADKNNELAGTGLTLTETGTVTGTPISTGTINFTAVATDDSARSDEKAFGIHVNPPVLIATDSLTDAKQGQPYSLQLTASGGTGIVTWLDRDGDLVATGLVLDSSGLLNGAALDTGTISFTARADDDVGSFDEKPLDLHVGPYFICGDVDNSGENANIADLTSLVAYLFQGGPAPPIIAAANVDGVGDVNIADLTTLVDYLFAGGQLHCSQ